MDYPGVVFPTGKRVQVDDYADTVETLPAARNEAEKFIRDQWDPKTYENAPISLQLIGRRHSEENLIAVLDVVEAARRDYSVRSLDAAATTTISTSLPSNQTQLSAVPAYDFISTNPVSVA